MAVRAVRKGYHAVDLFEKRHAAGFARSVYPRVGKPMIPCKRLQKRRIRLRIQTALLFGGQLAVQAEQILCRFAYGQDIHASVRHQVILLGGDTPRVKAPRILAAFFTDEIAVDRMDGFPRKRLA